MNTSHLSAHPAPTHRPAGQPPHHHDEPAGAGTRRPELWRLAVSATVHCLTGCAIGEILGMVLATWWGWGDVASIALAVTLAFLFGYALTLGPLLRSGLPFRRALRVTLAADTVSLISMETIDNVIMLNVPGAMDAGLANGLFWGSMIAALAIAFVLTVPVNYLLIRRGKGHATVHAAH